VIQRFCRTIKLYNRTSSCRSAAILAAALIVAASGANGLEQAPAGSTLLERCPGYAAHVKAGRAYLARGERERALDEFRQARKALESCIEQDKEAGNQTASVSGLAECTLPDSGEVVSN